MSKKVYIFLADGFEDIEGLIVVDLLRRAGIDIKTVSIKETTRIQTSHGITMLTDTTFAETIKAKKSQPSAQLQAYFPDWDSSKAAKQLPIRHSWKFSPKMAQ